MRLQLTTVNDPGVEVTGYKVIQCDSLDGIDDKLKDVSDNECLEIHAGTLLTVCTFSQQKELLEKVLRKLRLGGTIVLGGVDVNLFAKNIISGQLSVAEGCEFLSHKNMSDSTTTKQMLHDLGLQIQASELFGANFLVHASRTK